MRGNQPEPELQEKPGTTPNDHDIELEANLSGNTVIITCTSGDPAPRLPNGTGAHHFSFTLSDKTNLGVNFSSLDRQDGCITCPPQSGNNSTQIVPDSIRINPTTAAFTDRNQGAETDVAYQWNFTCSSGQAKVRPFDPIIKNGGGN
jgi:hypothetical protein